MNQQMNMIADTSRKKSTKPLLKTKGFSTLHVEIFEQILLSYQTNRALNQKYGYSLGSHQVVDHSRKVMHKLLALESLKKLDHLDQVIYPRKHRFWWKRLLDKHKQILTTTAVTPQYYEAFVQKR
ncbi:MAG: hypothetical protein EOP45_01490 [Sphingobacteriaceae bacterium]|nr:MAG: hypothetical protein EOP45_01490 [Sphingobacteriaceae bacterium]